MIIADACLIFKYSKIDRIFSNLFTIWSSDALWDNSKVKLKPSVTDVLIN